MLLLNSATMKVTITTGSAGDIEIGWSGIDKTGTGPASYSYASVPTDVPANISGSGTNDLVPVPAASTERNVGAMYAANNHATTSNAITIQLTDGTDTTRLWRGTLLAQEAVVFDQGGVWTVYGTDGNPKQTGQLLGLVLGAVGAANLAASDTDTLNVFARKVAGCMALKTQAPSGIEQFLQESLSHNGSSLYLPNNGTTVGLNTGLAWTTGGTVSHPTPSSTSPAIYNQQKRTRWANVVTTTNQVLGLRTATAEKRYWRGNAAGLGGWFFHARFAIGLWPAATVRLFVGLNDSNSGWVISDTLTGNGCGFWHDTTDAASVLSFATRDGTTANKAAITLAANLAAGQCFDAYIYSPPNGSFIGYRLVELNTGTVLVDTTTTTNIPLTTAFLGQELAMSNGTANTTVTTTAFELSGHSCQSDY